MTDATVLLDEFILGDARGGRKKSAPVQVSVSRELSADDLMALVDLEAPADAQSHSTILKIRHSHHQLARHIAAGTEMVEVSAITGYSLSYISVLKADPAFQDLLKYYESQREEIFVDTLERAKTLSIVALEELHERLVSEPESFKHRELMEVAELGISADATKRGLSGGANNSSGGITISFITPEPKPDLLGSGPMIDISLDEGEE